MAWRSEPFNLENLGIQAMDKESWLVNNDSFAAGSQNLLTLLNFTAHPNHRMSLVSLICNASVDGTATFTDSVSEYTIALPLVTGLNIIKAENSPFWFFSKGGTLSLVTASATLTNVQIVLGVF